MSTDAKPLVTPSLLHSRNPTQNAIDLDDSATNRHPSGPPNNLSAISIPMSLINADLAYSITIGNVANTAGGHAPLLLVKLTGYRILNLVLIVSFVVAKAILTYQGRPEATTLDWLLGGAITIGLWWAGLYESINPPVWQLFFHTDYSYQVLTGLAFVIRVAFVVVYTVYVVYVVLHARKVYDVGGSIALYVFSVESLVIFVLFAHVVRLFELAKIAPWLRHGREVEYWRQRDLTDICLHIFLIGGIFMLMVTTPIYLHP